jgi:hypothetical protein
VQGECILGSSKNLRIFSLLKFVTKVFTYFDQGSLSDKSGLQKLLLSLKNPTRLAAGEAHCFFEARKSCYFLTF